MDLDFYVIALSDFVRADSPEASAVAFPTLRAEVVGVSTRISAVLGPGCAGVSRTPTAQAVPDDMSDNSFILAASKGVNETCFESIASFDCF
jgi:hypothetical protein